MNLYALTSHLTSNLTIETLFQIFYQYPRDINQELAAHELVNRDWRWHKVLRQWLRKDTREANAGGVPALVDLANGAPIGAQPIRKSERIEQGVYIFMNTDHWRRERRYLDLDYESLDSTRVPAAGVGAVNGGGMAFGGMGNAGAVAAPTQPPGRIVTDMQQLGQGSSQIGSA